MGEKSLEPRKKSGELDMNDLGPVNSLRYAILTAVINEDFEIAMTKLKDFLAQDSAYPHFRLKVERYINHSLDLILAIKTKRNFPGLNSLTRSKQQELKEKVKEHFQDLKQALKKIEKSMEELRVSDIKSTNLVVQSFWLSLAAVFVSGFLIDLMNDVGGNAYNVLDEKSAQFLELVFRWLE